MKTKLYLPIISLLAMSVFAFISCDDSDSDTTCLLYTSDAADE